MTTVSIYSSQIKYSSFAFFTWLQDISCCLSAAAAAAKSLQLCPTLCDPRDGSPTGSPIPGILQTRTLEWVAIFFSNAWKWKVKMKSLSRVQLPETPWTAAHQAPPPTGFSRQEYWSGVPLPSPMKYLDNTNWCTFLYCFAYVKKTHEMENVNFLMPLST